MVQPAGIPVTSEKSQAPGLLLSLSLVHLPRASHLPTHLILNAAHFTDRDSEAQQGELCPEMAGLGFAWSPSGSRGHTLSHQGESPPVGGHPACQAVSL